MENSKEVLQQICSVIVEHYENVKEAHTAYNTFETAIKKHNTTVSRLVLGIDDEADYEKIIWQIMADLRLQRDIDLDFDEMSAGFDSYYLSEIAGIIYEKGKYEGKAETSAINYDEYCEICQANGLEM